MTNEPLDDIDEALRADAEAYAASYPPFTEEQEDMIVRILRPALRRHLDAR